MNNPYKDIKEKRIAVALSGGVDSTYALVNLMEAGFEVIGITLKTHCFSKNPHSPKIEKACTSLESISTVSQLCEDLKIPHHIIIAEDLFQEKVIDYFVQTYKEGRTPNPCVQCNKWIKWDFLRQESINLGFNYIATGHYAKIFFNENSGQYELIQNPDNIKDQTYMLWQLSQDDLAHTIFPLSGFSKAEVRNKIEKYSNEISQKGDSQGICFVDQNKYTDFLSEYPFFSPDEGDILDKEGNILGRHKGYWRYTIGQRRGLGISSEKPLYVLDINAQKNTVTIGNRTELFHEEVRAKDLNFIKYKSIDKPLKVTAKVRYSQKNSSGVLTQEDDNTIKVVFDDPQTEIAPGQSLVVYEDNSLVVGGVII